MDRLLICRLNQFFLVPFQGQLYNFFKKIHIWFTEISPKKFLWGFSKPLGLFCTGRGGETTQKTSGCLNVLRLPWLHSSCQVVPDHLVGQGSGCRFFFQAWLLFLTWRNVLSPLLRQNFPKKDEKIMKENLFGVWFFPFSASNSGWKNLWCAQWREPWVWCRWSWWDTVDRFKESHPGGAPDSFFSQMNSFPLLSAICCHFFFAKRNGQHFGFGSEIFWRK